jgi:hypothetical protein
MTRLVVLVGALAALYLAAHLWRDTSYGYTILWTMLLIVAGVLYGVIG